MRALTRLLNNERTNERTFSDEFFCFLCQKVEKQSSWKLMMTLKSRMKAKCHKVKLFTLDFDEIKGESLCHGGIE